MLIKDKTHDLTYAVDKAVYDAGRRATANDVYKKIVRMSQARDQVYYVIRDKVRELNARANRR